jgi:hypothetical protein
MDKFSLRYRTKLFLVQVLTTSTNSVRGEKVSPYKSVPLDFEYLLGLYVHLL